MDDFGSTSLVLTVVVNSSLSPELMLGFALQHNGYSVNHKLLKTDVRRR